MLEFSNFMLFTMLSTLLVELFHVVISVIFPYREYIAGDTDQSITDEIMKVILTNYIYATSKLRTTKCNWPIGIVVGRITKTNIYWFAYINIQTSDSNQSNKYTFNVQLYSTKAIELVHKDDVDDDDNESIEDSSDGYMGDYVDGYPNNDSPTNGSQNKQKKPTYLTTYRKYGKWKGSDYRKITIRINPALAVPSQTQTIEQISDMAKTSKANGFTYGGFFLITGPTGCGKSTIAKLLANHLKGTLCDDFILTKPGYSIYDLINVVEPETDSPLVLLLDEIDQSILKLHKGMDDPHKWLNTVVSNKETWNTFSDQLPDYDNLIIIATSNKPKEWFDNLDPSYLRPGRINKYFKLNTIEGKPLAEKINQMRFQKTKEDKPKYS